MADKRRDHDLPKRYKICCLSCCELEFETFEPIPREGFPGKTIRKCVDSSNDCAELQKKVGKGVGGQYQTCHCRLFRLVKVDPPDPAEATKKKKAMWELVTDDTAHKKDQLNPPQSGEDKEYYYECFCVAEVPLEDQ